jgi:hypothetical protein
MFECFRRRLSRLGAELEEPLTAVQQSLDAAAVIVTSDAEAALDDILAARLIVATLLARIVTAEGKEPRVSLSVSRQP